MRGMFGPELRLDGFCPYCWPVRTFNRIGGGGRTPIGLGERHLRHVLLSYIIHGEGCARTARRGAGRTHSLPTGPGRIASPVWCVRKSLMLPAGEIPAPERGTSSPTGNRALGSWRQRHELSGGTSDKRAVTQVKRLSLVMIVTRRPTASYWLEGNSRSPQEAMVTGDCGGVREDRKLRNGSIEEPERSTVVWARSGNEP